MRICIIDGLTDKELVTHNLHRYKVENGEVKLHEQSEQKSSRISHGTVVCQMISQYGKFDEIYLVEVLDETESGTIENLETALRWCLNQEIDMINLSIGSIEEDNFPVLKELCQKLYEQGKIIIAAENNNDIYSAPSIFDEVVSVKRIKLRHILIYDCKKNRIFISGKKWLRFHNESYTRTQNSNSYACAFASCVISRKDKNRIYDSSKWRYKILWTK